MVSRLLVTGGTGYLGRAVAAAAERAGWVVTAVGSSIADIRDPESVRALVRDIGPNVIVHTAYRKDTRDAREVIEEGSAHVAAAANEAGARLVHVSSDVVFDGRAGRPYRETDRPSPLTDYGRSKAAAELRVAALADDAVIVRTSLIYGGPSSPPSLHELVAHDHDATFYVDEIRCPIQVDDLARALVELATSDVAGIVHVAGPEALSRRDFAELIVGRRVKAAPAPPGRVLDCRLDSTQASRLLTFAPRAVSDVYRRRVVEEAAGP